MSILRCERCPRQIDTDLDMECEVYIGNMRRLHATIVLCPGCRQKRDDQREAEESAASRCMEEAERSAP